MPGSTAKEAFAHLLTDVLGLDTPDIKQIAKAGIHLYSRLKSNTYDNINTLYQDKDISIDVFRLVSYWKLYTNDNSPPYDVIM